MNVELTHPFILRCLSHNIILNDCQLLSTFCSRVEKQSESSMDVETYKGDALELLTEAFIKLSPIDKRIGIFNYSPTPEGTPGVDGFGIGFNLRPATVQVKWRSNTDYVLTANTDHLCNFTSISYRVYKVNVEDNENMLIVTTAKDLHHYTDAEMFGGQVRTINREKIIQLIDDNLSFWKNFKELWDDAKNKICPK